MAFGSHPDNPLIGDSETLRSDISMTVFLSDSASYDGGELRLETPFGAEEAKLFPGDAVVYATVVPHEVVEISRRGARRGHRRAAERPCATRPSARSSTT